MDKKTAIETLEQFKKLLSKWEYESPTSTTRSEINRNIPIVKSLIVKAGVSKSLTFSPPPAVGGLIMKNVDPFTCIFEAPYGLSVVPVIIDSIDEALGIIETNETFFDEPKKEKAMGKLKKSNRVFIVHGRDNELKETTARFVEKFGLVPIILHEQTNRGKTIIEKFEEFSDVSFAIVLMTPDDFGYYVDEPDNKQLRARQNVVFELGYFIGKLGRHNVAAIVKGNIEVPTDINGVVYIGVDTSNAWKMILAKELKAAGLNVDLNRLI